MLLGALVSLLSHTCARLCRGASKRAQDTPCLIRSVAPAQGSALPACLCGSSPAGSQGLSHGQNRLGFSPQSPKGFLESYEEMLSYALRPETWATTRLELEGRGVSGLC